MAQRDLRSFFARQRTQALVQPAAPPTPVAAAPPAAAAQPPCMHSTLGNPRFGPPVFLSDAPVFLSDAGKTGVWPPVFLSDVGQVSQTAVGKLDYSLSSSVSSGPTLRAGCGSHRGANLREASPPPSAATPLRAACPPTPQRAPPRTHPGHRPKGFASARRRQLAHPPNCKGSCELAACPPPALSRTGEKAAKSVKERTVVYVEASTASAALRRGGSLGDARLMDFLQIHTALPICMRTLQYGSGWGPSGRW
eukprot:gene24390-biopygen22389